MSHSDSKNAIKIFWSEISHYEVTLTQDLEFVFKIFNFFDFFSFIFSNWLILTPKKRKYFFVHYEVQVTWDLNFFQNLKKNDFFFVYFFDLTNLIYLFFQTQINGLIHIHTGSIMRCKRIPKHLWFLWSRNLQPSYFRRSLLVFLPFISIRYWNVR